MAPLCCTRARMRSYTGGLKQAIGAGGTFAGGLGGVAPVSVLRSQTFLPCEDDSVLCGSALRRTSPQTFAAFSS